ncbi:MAG TPA: dockerin type I repeat-containing protein, partial [Patescibacteria group bacterium]|nr:dockerin type I repeat-containing protein [Patescibacteria group bacterium]
TNATSCTASNAWSGTKATSGSQSVSPASTSTYTLTCTGSGGSGNASISVTVNAVVNQLPQGSFDEIRTSDGVVRGWTVDLDSSTSANDVQIFFNGPVGTGTRVFSGPTSILRADVNSSLGISGNHGFEFTIPTSYRDGKSHSVYVYGIDINDSTKSTLLTGSPKSFTLSASIAVVGDINQDHIVNSIDYSILNTHWFTADSASDLNHDGIVNAIDYSILNSNWFKTW